MKNEHHDLKQKYYAVQQECDEIAQRSNKVLKLYDNLKNEHHDLKQKYTDMKEKHDNTLSILNNTRQSLSQLNHHSRDISLTLDNIDQSLNEPDQSHHPKHVLSKPNLPFVKSIDKHEVDNTLNPREWIYIPYSKCDTCSDIPLTNQTFGSHVYKSDEISKTRDNYRSFNKQHNQSNPFITSTHELPGLGTLGAMGLNTSSRIPQHSEPQPVQIPTFRSTNTQYTQSYSQY